MGCCIRKTEEAELIHTPPLVIEEKFMIKEVDSEMNNGPAPVKTSNIDTLNLRSNIDFEDNGCNSNLYENNKPDKNTPQSPYDKRVLELINQVRVDPNAYADLIEESMECIQEEKGKLIFKQKVKVALFRGKEAFEEAVALLRNMAPLNPLSYKEEISVKIPEDEPSIRDPKYILQQIEEIQQHSKVDMFFKDLIKVPDVAVMLMIVDDSGKSSGKKRDAVLNQNYKYIGLSNTTLNKIFTAYFTFSS